MTPSRSDLSTCHSLLIILGIAFFSCLIMFGGLTNTEVIDDHNLFHVPEMRGCGKNPVDCLRHPLFGLYYRPLLGVSFSIGENLHGLNPYPFHVENLALHFVVTLLAGWFFLLLFRKSSPAIISTLIFALHPLQVTVTTFIGGRTDLILLFFVFLFGIGLLKSGSSNSPITWRILSIFGYLGAMFSKEQCLLLPFLAPLLIQVGKESPAESDSRQGDLPNGLRPARKNLWIVWYALPAIFYFVCAAQVIPPDAINSLTSQKLGSGLHWSLPLHAEMFLRSAWYYVKCYFYPIPDTLHKSSVGAWDTPQTGVILMAIASLSAFIMFTWKTRKNQALLTLNLWTALTLLPCLNIIPISSQFVACYRALLPLVGVSGATGFILSQCLFSEASDKRRGIAGWGVVAGLTLVLASLSLWDIPVWKSDLNVTLAEAHADPNFVPGVAGVGSMLQREGKNQEALGWYDRAIEAYFPGANSADERIAQKGQPEFRRRMKSCSSLHWSISEMISGAMRGRGGVHQSMKQYDAAIEDYRVALAFNPEDDEVREAWVNCALQTNRLAEALREEQTLVQRNPSSARLYALGYLFLKLGKWDEAKTALQQAYDKTPSNNENLRFEIMNYLLKANAKRN